MLLRKKVDNGGVVRSWSSLSTKDRSKDLVHLTLGEVTIQLQILCKLKSASLMVIGILMTHVD